MYYVAWHTCHFTPTEFSSEKNCPYCSFQSTGVMPVKPISSKLFKQGAVPRTTNISEVLQHPLSVYLSGAVAKLAFRRHIKARRFPNFGKSLPTRIASKKHGLTKDFCCVFALYITLRI